MFRDRHPDGKPQPLIHTIDLTDECSVFVFDPARYRDLVQQGGSDLRIDLNDLGRSDKR